MLWHLSYALSTQGNKRGTLLPLLKGSYRFILAADPGYVYTYASFVLLLFLHWMYIRNFFLDFFSFFLIFMGEIAFTSIFAVTFLCESAIWNNKMGLVLRLRLGSGVRLELRIVIEFRNINRIQITYLWIHIFLMLFLYDFMGFLLNFDTFLF